MRRDRAARPARASASTWGHMPTVVVLTSRSALAASASSVGASSGSGAPAGVWGTARPSRSASASRPRHGAVQQRHRGPARAQGIDNAARRAARAQHQRAPALAASNPASASAREKARDVGVAAQPAVVAAHEVFTAPTARASSETLVH